MTSSARLDPLELLRQQETTRLPWLLPERRRRMAESPFAFFRGAAIVMAADLGRQPHSGLMVHSAAMPICSTSDSTAPPNGNCCSASTTSMKPTPGPSSGMCSGWPPVLCWQPAAWG